MPVIATKLNALQAAVLACLRRLRAAHLPGVARAAGVGRAQARQTLQELESLGLAACGGGLWKPM